MKIKRLLSLFKLCYKTYLFTIANQSVEEAAATFTSLENFDAICLQEATKFTSFEALDENVSRAKITAAFLSVCYARGYGVEKDAKKCAEYANRFKTFDWLMELMDTLNEFIEKNGPDNNKCIRRRALVSHVCYLVGELHRVGIQGKMGQDRNMVFRCFFDSVKSGKYNPHAFYNLGWCYTFGFGTPIDDNAAFTCYQKGAKLGLAMAECSFGLCFYQGMGTEKDKVKAVEWMKKAADKGFATAQNNYACFLWDGVGGLEKDRQEAFALYEKAANQGQSDSMRRMGSFCHDGIMTEKNTDKAIEWYRKAADKHDAKAIKWLDQNKLT